MKKLASRWTIQLYTQCKKATFSRWRITLYLSRRTELKNQSTMRRPLSKTRTERQWEPCSYSAISRNDADLNESVPSWSTANEKHVKMNATHAGQRRPQNCVFNWPSIAAAWGSGSTAYAVERSRGRRDSMRLTVITPEHPPLDSMNSSTKSIPTTANAFLTPYAKR